MAKESSGEGQGQGGDGSAPGGGNDSQSGGGAEQQPSLEGPAQIVDFGKAETGGKGRPFTQLWRK